MAMFLTAGTLHTRHIHAGFKLWVRSFLSLQHWSQQVNHIRTWKCLFLSGSTPRHLLFLLQDEKEPIFNRSHKEQEERPHCKAIEQTQDPSPNNWTCLAFCSDDKNFHQDQMVNSKNNNWLALFLHEVPIVMKTKHPIHIMLFRVITSNGDLCLHSSSLMDSDPTLKPGDCWKTQWCLDSASSHAVREFDLVCQKISATSTPTSGWNQWWFFY